MEVLTNGLNDAAKKIHAAAKAKGFWDREPETGTTLMLCVSELSEALEADRKHKYASLEGFENQMAEMNKYSCEITFRRMAFEDNIKDTFEDELADTMIRILDLCGREEIDIEKHMELKIKYNATRERLHGKKY